MLSAKPQASGTTIKKLKLFGLDLLLENLGRFPFNQNFRKFGNNGKWYRKFPGKSFQKFRKLLNFRNANHSTENSGNSGSKVEWKGNFREKNSKIWVYPPRLSSLFEILENAVPFATVKFRILMLYNHDVIRLQQKPNISSTRFSGLLILVTEHAWYCGMFNT